MTNTFKILAGVILIIVAIWLFQRDPAPSQHLPETQVVLDIPDATIQLRANELIDHVSNCLTHVPDTDFLAIVNISKQDCYPCVNEVDEYTRLLRNRNIPIIAGIRSNSDSEANRFIEVTNLEFDCFESIPIQEGITNSIFLRSTKSSEILHEIILSPNRISALSSKQQTLNSVFDIDNE